MLSRGLTGTLTLVVRERRAAAAAADPLQEADAYIAEGNIAAARAVLEAALAARPTRADLAGTLLELYRRSRDAAGLRAMRARLGAGLTGAGAWSEVEREIDRAQDAAR